MSETMPLRAIPVEIKAVKIKKAKKWPFLDPKIEFLANKMIFAGKMSLGTCFYIIKWEPYARFGPILLARSRDRGYTVTWALR